MKFLTTDVMKNFNSTNMGDDYNTSQSNLNGAGNERAPSRASAGSLARGQESGSLAGSPELQREPEQRGGRGGSAMIVDEMGQDMHYLNREAPLDGGESTFGAYSTIGGGQSAVHSVSTRSITRTVRRTQSRELNDDQLSGSEDQQQPANTQNDSFDYRLDSDELNGGALQPEIGATGSGRAPSPLETSQLVRSESVRLVEQMQPDNVDIQRPMQQAG